MLVQLGQVPRSRS